MWVNRPELQACQSGPGDNSGSKIPAEINIENDLQY
jgi:hypothetical protein